MNIYLIYIFQNKINVMGFELADRSKLGGNSCCLTEDIINSVLARYAQVNCSLI